MRAERRAYEVNGRGLCTVFAALCLLASGEAAAYGGLVTPDGPGTITAARALVARGADEVRIVAQIRYTGTPATAVWLFPIPNSVMMGGEIAARTEAFGQAGLDELAAATDPTFTGECDGMPTGMRHTVPQIDQFGPAPAMALPTRYFTATEIFEGDVETYLDSVGITADEALGAAIRAVGDQNFMMAAVRIDTAMLGVNRVDPIVAIRYPHTGDIRLGLRMLATSAGATAPDLVLWLLDQGRTTTPFQTRELDYGEIRFVTPTETNYDEVFTGYLGTRQSQAFAVEAAQPVGADTFADAELSALIADTGAGFLTRIHGRPLPIVLQGNLAFLPLRADAGGAVSPEHAVTGFGCGVEPDMGVDVDMGGTPADMGGDPADMGGEPGDLDGGADSDAEADEGGGGGASGCLAAPGLTRGWPALLLLPFLLLPGLRRRR